MKIKIIYDEPDSLFKKLFGQKIKQTLKLKRKMRIRKLEKLTKKQIGSANTYLRKNGLLVRIALMGNKTWEVWYN